MLMNPPLWLSTVSVVSLVLALVCALVITLDIAVGRRQHMWIMNVVWPITALYSGPLGLWAYWAIGRAAKPTHHHDGHNEAHHNHSVHSRPFWQSVGLATTHCGSGCTLGDLVVEGFLISWIPFTLFGHAIFATWLVDFVAAFLFGVAFQYFSIAALKKMSAGKVLLDALKVDALSLSAWQVGMYGWMAVVTFVIFGHELDKGSAVFWFMMQIAMLAGFATSYPVNWWLVRKGIKEAM